MLKIFTKINALLIVVMLLATGFIMSACNDDEDISSEIVLNSFGPSPALRGGELKFIGLNLDKVNSILLPGNVEVSTFKTKTPGLLIIDVPEETMEGQVILKTPQGNITSKTMLGISEPITIASISPGKARPGDVVTIAGTYLNLVEEVIFSNNKAVAKADFMSQSKDKIEVKVPADAKTGLVVVSNGEEDPILVESANEFEVTLPAISSMTPGTIKAGTTLTIAGSDLDLVEEVAFAGGSKVAKADLVLTEEGNMQVTVPANAQDGKVKLIVASLVEVVSASDLTMVVPTVASVSPNPAKTGANITVTGTDLDLVNSVVFGGDKTGTIVNKTATEITVTVPTDAVSDVVKFNTAANKSVSSATLNLVKPAITSISPTDVMTLSDITITGTNLDVVSKVIFTGDTEGTIKSQSSTQLVVTVPTRSQSGKITLIATNGDEVVSNTLLTITAGNVPSVSNMPNSAKPGEMITITGLKLDLATEVIFPGGVKATVFGAKTSSSLEVVVPEKTAIGVGRITFVTIEGDVSESPEINIVGSIKYYIYKDALNSEWQKWNGWGTPLQDLANTEQVNSGTQAIKLGYNDAYGAMQLHPTSANVLAGYTHIVLSVYGTVDSRIAIQLKTSGGAEPETAFDIKAGKYTLIEVPISSFGDVSGGIVEIRVKNYGTNPNTIYVDDLGLR